MELVKPHQDGAKKEEKSELRPYRVFVYGTLKRGYGNHERILKDAVFLGKARTNTKWTMIGKDMGYPYVVEQDHVKGNHVVGEVFAVNREELKALDILEGVPHHYKKVTININYEDDNSVDTVGMYVKAYVSDSVYKGKEIITEWVA